MGGLAPRSPW